MPNGADRIVAMAESQSRHRQTLEARVVNGNVAARTRGQYCGFLLGLIALVGGIGLIAYDKNTQGLATIITAFTSLAAVFIYGRWQQERERERKRQDAKLAAESPRLPFDE
jgi:uncharacterized membrane protein